MALPVKRGQIPLLTMTIMVVVLSSRGGKADETEGGKIPEQTAAVTTTFDPYSGFATRSANASVECDSSKCDIVPASPQEKISVELNVSELPQFQTFLMPASLTAVSQVQMNLTSPEDASTLGDASSATADCVQTLSETKVLTASTDKGSVNLETTAPLLAGRQQPQPAHGPIKLYIMGVFSMSGWDPEGRAHEHAVRLAMEDINARPDVLPGYSLVLVSIDSQGEISVALEGMFRLLFNDTMFIMVLGGTFSHVSEQIATVARKYNMLQVSDSSISPTLSGPEYPWFFRVLDSEFVLTRVRVLLLRHFNWTTITLIQGPQRLHSATMEEMRKEMKVYGMMANASLPFETDPSSAIATAKRTDRLALTPAGSFWTKQTTQFLNGARVLFLASEEDSALKAVCAAYRLGLYGPRVVWIIQHFFDIRQDDFVTNCTMQEKLQVLDGYFTVASVAILEGNNDTIGANETEYHRRFKDLVSAEKLAELEPLKVRNLTEYDRQVELWTARTRNYDGSVYILRGQNLAPHGYDATWAAALALNATLSHLLDNGSSADALADFSYEKRELGEVIYHKMQETSFWGLSGQVSFNPAGDRVPLIAVRQFRVLNFSTGDVKFKTFGYYEGSTMTWLPNHEIYWRGNKVAVSSRQYQRELQTLPLPVLASTGALAAAAIFQSLAFLYFNIRHRHVRIIRMSSPSINNLILLGCILFICSVFVHDFSGRGIHVMCHIRLCLLVLGFSLSYGALFAKTWRVYEVMTASKKLSKVRKDLRDRRLYLTVLMLVTANMAVVVIWVSIDTIVLTPVDVPDSAREVDEDVTELGQTLVCQSRYKLHFTVLLFALQGLLIVLGTYLALQTRQVTIPQLNDSKWIGMCVYNCFVLGGVGAILVLGMQQSPEVTYLIESFLVIIGTVVTQSLIFVPKLMDYRRLTKGRQQRAGIPTLRTLSLDSPSGQSSDFSVTASENAPSDTIRY